ncbi:response regulator [Nostoc sp. UHCC 0302]|uniref:hybrid sensor histidine kinase/response regulator n=1 Tax=Nostoc sp. UHCC 0302 TaxID=3134896 RepID=UPI00311CB06A
MSNHPPATILHVDDNETTRYIVTRMLRNEGFIVMEAATGEAGLQLVASHPPDLIVLDVKLPDISGFEVCQRIKSNPATAFIPVLHLSASYIESKDKAQGLNSGADGYLVHPVESIELIATVKSLLRIRQAEESALALARQWQITFDSISDGVGLLDKEGRFVRCNTTMMSLLQKPLSEIIGGLHQEVTQTLVGSIDATPFTKTQETRHRESLEVQSGSSWFSVTIDPIFDQAGFTGAVYILADITDRRRAEEALRFLAEASTVMASSLDYETTLTNIANLAVSQIADWCIIDMVEDDGLVHRLAVSHRDAAKAELARELARSYPLNSKAIAGMPKVIRTGIPEVANEISENLLLEYARDEEHLQLLQSLGIHSLIMLPLIVNGQVIGAMALISDQADCSYSTADLTFAQDLARRVALAVDNARLYREAQNTNRMKDEFLATLSHELRSPLNAMLGWIRLLNTRNFDEVTKTRAMETIERSAKSQAQLVEDLLDVSRIIQGKLRLNVRPIELSSVIEAAIETVRPAIQAKEIQFQVVLDPKAGPVAGDSDRLQQVVWNLLSNAIKFTPKGGDVIVRLEPVNSHVEITVKDTGQGINSEFVPYVFDRFRQADSSITRVYSGLGLGLAIVRHLVELHGGTVMADSQGVGHGATFKVKLPLIPAQVRANSILRVHPTVKSEVLLDNLPSLNGVRVLIVDDETDSRDFLFATLEQYGADVTAVASASEALAGMIKMKLDVLISDIGMPFEDGYSLIRKVRRLTKEQGGQIPAIALTAYARPEDRMRAIAAGFQMHVPKPVEPAELATVVASLTGRTGQFI